MRSHGSKRPPLLSVPEMVIVCAVILAGSRARLKRNLPAISKHVNRLTVFRGLLTNARAAAAVAPGRPLAHRPGGKTEQDAAASQNALGRFPPMSTYHPPGKRCASLKW
jgi:hypothetical protein